MPHADPRLARLIELRSLRCPTCEYDLAGMDGSRCPECGVELTLRSFQHPVVRPGYGRCAAFLVVELFVTPIIGIIVVIGLSAASGSTGAWAVFATAGCLLFLAHLTYLGVAVFRERVLWDRPGRLRPLVLVSVALAMVMASAAILS